MIELTHLHFGFSGGSPVLDDLSINIEKGSFSVLVGASGSGKTTLLRIIAGLLKPNKGTVRLDGRVAMVFQNGALLPWQNISENISQAGTDRDQTEGQKGLRASRARRLQG
jgi:NitT/TauT family transport system ATP-binding protein